jgi:hypothetical protein
MQTDKIPDSGVDHINTAPFEEIPSSAVKPISYALVRVKEDYISELSTGIHSNKVIVTYKKDGICLQKIEDKYLPNGEERSGDPLFVQDLSSDKGLRSLFEVSELYQKGRHTRMINRRGDGICSIEDKEVASNTYIAVLGADLEHTLCLAPISFKEIDDKRQIYDISLQSVVQHTSFFRTEKPSSDFHQEDSDMGSVHWAGLLKLRRSEDGSVNVCIKGWSGHYKTEIKHYVSIIHKLENMGFDENNIVVIGMNNKEYNSRIFKDTFAETLLKDEGINNVR